MQEDVTEAPIAVLSATEKYLADLQALEASKEQTNEVLHFELSTTIPDAYETPKPVVEEKIQAPIIDESLQFVMTERPASGIVNKPANIYAQSEAKPFNSWLQEETKAPETPAETPTPVPTYKGPVFEFEKDAEETPVPFELHEKPTAPVQAIVGGVGSFDDIDEAEDQRRRAQERIQKLRNLSFNMNSADANSDFETVPAYIRQKMDLYGNAFTSAENFYSKYTVGKDEHNNTNISSINTFLDGKRPD
jgi:cell division protein FtsZ